MSENERQRGVVLVMAVVLMVGVVLISVSTMNMSLAHGTIDDERKERLRLSILAEGGIDLGYQRLADDPTFRGKFTLTTAAGADVDVTLADVTGGLQITTSGTSGGEFDGGITAYLVGVSTSPAEVERPVELGGELILDGGSLSTDAMIRHQGNLQLRGGALVNGPTEQAGTAAFSIDRAAFMATATRTETALAIPAGSHHFDAMMVDGDLTIEGPAEISGSIFVTGSVTVDGNGGSVILGQSGQTLSLTVDGSVVVSDVTLLEVRGTIVVDGTITVANTLLINATGGMYTTGRMTLTGATTNWTHDPSVVTESAGVSGLPIQPGETDYQEAWRRTSITRATSSGGGSTSGGGTIDGGGTSDGSTIIDGGTTTSSGNGKKW